VVRAENRQASDILVLKSAEDGTFSGAAVPGPYRVAASKPGYDLLLTEVNLRARRLLELRLRQAARLILGDRPRGMEVEDDGLDWILRRPTGDILRDREVAPAGLDDDGWKVEAGDREGPDLVAWAPEAARWLDRLMRPLDGEISHLMTGEGLLGGDPAPGEIDGSTTRLALNGALGDGGSWRFDGRRGRSSAGAAADAPRLSRREDRLTMATEHALGSRDRLQAEIDLGMVRFARQAGGSTPDAADQAQRSAAVRSRWDRRLGPDVLLHVNGTYHEASLGAPDDRALLDAASGEERNGSQARDRIWRAEAGVALGTESHHVDLGVRASAYRHDLLGLGYLLAVSPETPGLSEPGDRGSAVSLFGQDDWRVAERYVVNYGLGYHGLLGEGSGSIVPRVGVTREPGRPGGTRVRSMFLFRLDDSPEAWGSQSAAPGSSPVPGEAGRIGYLVSVESALPGRIRVAAVVSYRPFEEMEGDPRGEALAGSGADGPIVLTDGAAGRHEVGVELHHGFGDLHGSLTGRIGRVEGMLAPAIDESPASALRLGEARYYLTRVRAFYAPTDTEVRIDYRRVVGALAAGPDDSDALQYRRVDLTVQQELPRFSQSVRFKVLMAYQGLLSDQSGAAAGGAAPLAASRLSGGVEIDF
jgi:hypothetical protein